MNVEIGESFVGESFGGESFVGEDPDAAHINTVFGLREGPVGTAFATALATPTAGHVPFLTVWSPGIPVEPPTLFVNKAAIASERHGRLTWGAAQAGVAEGVTMYMSNRFGDEKTLAELGKYVLIVAVWVNPDATSTMSVRDNNLKAVYEALDRGHRAAVEPTTPLAFGFWRSGERPHNPYLDTE